MTPYRYLWRFVWVRAYAVLVLVCCGAQAQASTSTEAATRRLLNIAFVLAAPRRDAPGWQARAWVTLSLVLFASSKSDRERRCRELAAAARGGTRGAPPPRL